MRTPHLRIRTSRRVWTIDLVSALIHQDLLCSLLLHDLFSFNSHTMLAARAGAAANPPTVGPSSPVPVFWIPSADRPPGKKFHQITFPHGDVPTLPYWKRNPDLLFECFLPSVILAIGAILLGTAWNKEYTSDGKDNTTRQLLAPIFFAAGMVPGVSAILEFVRSRFRRGVAIEDIPTTIFVILGVTLDDNASGSWSFYVGAVLFETGLIYWLSRALFFVPTPSDVQRNLKNEIESLKQSVAVGLANGYFLNFVRYHAKDLQTSPTPIRVSYRDPNPNGPQQQVLTIEMHIPYFLLIVPREIDWEKNEPIKNQ
jgi:hypothetical protein